jgi:glycosyltransferase involved in cell wall biosynthesis
VPIDVILPVLNECGALPLVLGAFLPGYDPLVIDNGSTDGSAEVARRLGARVVVEPTKGFGAACFAGLSAATSDVVCFMDCDGSLDPGELPRVADPVTDGSSDLVLGARQPTTSGAWPWHARLANRALALELTRRSPADARTRLTDIGPMRAASRTQLLELGLRDRRFGWPLEMVLKAAAAGWRIGEMPVTYRPRAAGESKVSGSLTGTVRAIRDMGALL